MRDIIHLMQSVEIKQTILGLYAGDIKQALQQGAIRPTGFRRCQGSMSASVPVSVAKVARTFVGG